MNNTKLEISKILIKLGISPDLKGYVFLREAIEMVMNDETLLHRNTTKIIYPTIAQQFKAKPMNVERTIRHAIETSADKADPEFSKEVFGGVVSVHRWIPTNSQFIGYVASYLVLAKEMKWLKEMM